MNHGGKGTEDRCAKCCLWGSVPELIAWLGQRDSSGLARKTTVLEMRISWFAPLGCLHKHRIDDFRCWCNRGRLYYPNRMQQPEDQGPILQWWALSFQCPIQQRKVPDGERWWRGKELTSLYLGRRRLACSHHTEWSWGMRQHQCPPWMCHRRCATPVD